MGIEDRSLAGYIAIGQDVGDVVAGGMIGASAEPGKAGRGQIRLCQGLDARRIVAFDEEDPVGDGIRCFGQVFDYIIKRNTEYVLLQLTAALCADMARYQGDRQVRQAEPNACRAGLTEEPFADEGRRRNACLFGYRTRPQHGGRAAASAAHSRYDCIDAQRFHL